MIDNIQNNEMEIRIIVETNNEIIYGVSMF